MKKNVKKEDKTEVMTFRVTAREKEIIEKEAEKEGFSTVASYLRAQVLMSMAMTGNVEAMKVVFSVVSGGIRDIAREKYMEVMSKKVGLVEE